MPGPIARAQTIKAETGLVARKASFHSETLTGNLTLDATYPNLLKLDPGGAHRDVTLLAEADAEGVTLQIVNAADAAENLVVKNDAGSTIATLNQNEEGIFYCDGTSWSLVRIATIALS